MTATNEIPFNQRAMANALRATVRARDPMEYAEVIMTRLRSQGFRVVPFPPLKSRAKLKANGKTNGHKANGHKPKLKVVKAKRGPGRPRKLAA